MPKFDIFLCHSSEHDEWANTFALNLQTLGYDVYNDATVRRPGEQWPHVLYDAARSVSAAIVLVGGQAYGRDWVKNEYNFFLTRRKEPDFRLLPLLVEPVTKGFEFPFLEAVNTIDFQPPKDYRAAFNELAQALPAKTGRGALPWKGALEMPAVLRRGAPESARQAVDLVFSKLRTTPVAILLAQADSLDGLFGELLLERWRETYGEDRVLAVTPPPYPNLSMEAFLASVGDRLGFSEPTASALALETAVAKRLAPKQPTLLFINGFERLPEAFRSYRSYSDSAPIAEPGRGSQAYSFPVFPLP